MAHNTDKQNLAFQITFTETNLRWQLDDKPRNQKLITTTKKKITKLKKVYELACKGFAI